MTRAQGLSDFAAGLGDTLKIDGNNNRVGINSTAPTEALDVGGNINATGNLTVDGTIPASKLTGALPAISGANLTNIISGVGISSGGTNIGYGVTTLNFVGSATTIEVSGTTANISPGGGGAIGTTGITTQTIFSNPNIINEGQVLNYPNHNYGVFGPVSVGAAITVGVGNTFVVV
jgi:hypothetical protein